MQDKVIIEDENEIEDVVESEFYRPLDFDKFNREEGHIYESIEQELDLDGVIRDLPEFDPTEDIEFDSLNDALGG